MPTRPPHIVLVIRRLLPFIAGLVEWLLTRRRPQRPPPRLASSRSRSRSLGPYERLEGCRLEGDSGHDGDSFRVRHARGVDVFRLYWVDACETHPGFPDRIGHQARYFGIAPSAVLRFGGEARRHTLSRLAGRTFTIYTRWERVMDSDRFQACVECDGRWLCEDLVAHGLARIHTMPAPHPDGTSESAFRARLRAAERQARLARRGAWSAAPR